MTTTPYRDLSICTLHDRYIPNRPTDWAAGELEAYKAWLQEQGGWDTRTQSRWDSLIDYRAAELDKLFSFPGYRLPPLEVTPEAQAEQLAARTLWQAPQVPMASHLLAQSLEEVRQVGGKGTQAAGKRLLELMHRFAKGRKDCLTLHGGLEWVGGLQLLVLGARVQLKLGAMTLADLPADDALAAPSRRLVSRWLRYVRQVIAYAFRLCVPTYGLTTKTPLQLCIPLTRVSDSVAAVACVTEQRTSEATVVLLPHTGVAEEHGLRYRLAARLMQFDYCAPLARQALDAALQEVRAIVPPFQCLTYGVPERADVLARVDDTTRHMVRAYAGGKPTSIEDPTADCFDVFQDDVAMPHRIGSFSSLALAVDFERSNRKDVGFRLSLATAGSQLGYALHRA